MSAASGDPTLFLETRRLTKSFGGVRALNGVSFAAAAGEIHAVVGENGAGKSTLMNILAGHFAPDAGEIHLDGHLVRLCDPHDALRRGITMIHQELMGFPDLTVAENVFMGREPGAGRFGWLDRTRQHREAAALLSRLGVALAPDRRLKELSIAEQQTVEIAKALAHRARVLIMDEPTSAISAIEAQALFTVIRDLQRSGVTILYISHRLEEVLQLAHRITVLRDGAQIITGPVASFDSQRLIALMVGREDPAPAAKTSNAAGDIALEARHLGRQTAFRDVTFTLRRGEVLGLAGLMGAGRTEVAGALYGLTPAERGEIRVDGRPVRIRHPREALVLGIAMVTEDRRASGLVPTLSLGHNLTLASLRRFCYGPFIRPSGETEAALEQMRAFAIKAEGPQQPVVQLSGGNQQKALLARALLTRPRILILDEPTRGIDIAAKAEVHAMIRRLAGEGLAVLLISSELPELLALSDRVLVMRQGRLTAEFPAHAASPDEILAHAMPT